MLCQNYGQLDGGGGGNWKIFKQDKDFLTNVILSEKVVPQDFFYLSK